MVARWEHGESHGQDMSEKWWLFPDHNRRDHVPDMSPDMPRIYPRDVWDMSRSKIMQGLVSIFHTMRRPSSDGYIELFISFSNGREEVSSSCLFRSVFQK